MNTPIPQSDLVSNGKCIILYASLAQKLGLNEAIIVQQLHFLLGLPGGRTINGEHWIFNTYEQWQRDHFPFWSLNTIQRTFTTLESMMVVESCQPDGAKSRKKYYRLNHGMWAKLMKGTLPTLTNPDHTNLGSSSHQNGMIEDTNLASSLTETTVQRSPNRESEESKETAPSVAASWKPSNRDKNQELRTLRMPKEYPTQDEFNDYLSSEELGMVIEYRTDLYQEICRHKWHHWNTQSHRWLPIRDWRKYVAGLNSKINEAYP